MSAITDTDLGSAFERIEAFLAVQAGTRGRRLIEAVDRLQAAAGIGPAERAQIAQGLARLDSLDPRAGDVMLGVLIGALATGERRGEVVH